MDYGRTRVIQVTNIAPQATRDQMHTLFSHLGKIEDLRLYPSVRDASVTIQARVCFIKFIEEAILPISLHMTNTVFIDRAIIVQPFMNGDIPDELSGLEFANSSLPRGESRLPPHVTNMTTGDQIITVDESLASTGLPLFPPLNSSIDQIITVDESLASTGLPLFPPLNSSIDQKMVEEIRRTIVVMGIGTSTAAQEVMDCFATGAGEVKYFRWCAKEVGGQEVGRMALMEFTDYGAIIPAMRLNNTMIGESVVTVYYSSQAITKPQAKSNEAALKEIEEAMKKVKEAQNLVSAAVDPLMGMLGVKGKASRSRSRTPSRNRDYYRRSRSRDRGSRRRSRSRDRYRRRTRSRDRRRSRSRERRRRSRSRKRSRSKKRSRTRSRDRKRDSEKNNKSDREPKSVKEETKEIVEEPENGDAVVKVEGDENGAAVATNGKDEGSDIKKKSRSRSGSGSRKKSRSRERRRSRSKERKRSRSRSKKRSKRSRSREKRKRTRSRERRRSRSRSRDKRRSRSRDYKHKKSKHGRKSREREEKESKKEITRDYDQEEVGYESGNKGAAKEEKHEAVDMEISNSP